MDKMILNWKFIVMGFIVAVVLYVAGASLVQVSILKGILYVLAPIIGGFTVTYLNNEDYVTNIINGSFASGMAGFTAVFIILWLIEPVPVFEGNLGLIIVIAVIRAVMAFVIGAVLGLIGGMMGILIKAHDFKKENLI